MVQRIGSGAQAGASGAEPLSEVYVLQFGDSLDSLAERFGLQTAAQLAEFRALNPLLASGRALPGALVRVPAGEAHSPAVAAGAQAGLAAGAGATLETAWTEGVGRNVEMQNRFNGEIADARATRWPGMDPLIFKSILAQESGFQPNASNRFGYAGIAQMGFDEARAKGLSTGRSRRGNSSRGRLPYFDRASDERFDYKREIPAAVALLHDKANALDTGIAGRGRDLRGFEYYGRPKGDDFWRFAAAAYNGGEGTILIAMKLAYGDTPPDVVRWRDLVESTSGLRSQSPLWRACRAVGFNPNIKYREISEYADNVVRRARQ